MAFLVRRQTLSSGCLPVFLISAGFFDIRGLTGCYSTTVSLVSKPCPEDTGTAVPIVSKSSFLLLSVAFLTAAASLQSGSVRSGRVGTAVRYEARANIASIKDDARAIRNEAKRAPYDFKTFWNDVCRDFWTIEEDAVTDARLAARRFSN